MTKTKIPTSIDLSKYKPRPIQTEVLDFMIKSVKDNKKFIMIDSPVGSGKSILAMMFANWYKQNWNPHASFDLITNSKSLQTQYTHDLKFLNDLKGKENYNCSEHRCSCALGKEYGELKKVKCDECPYDEAKDLFFSGEISLTNYHMFNTYRIFLPEVAWKRSANVLIVDECHSFSDVFCDFISIQINKFLLLKSGIDVATTEKIINHSKANNNIEDAMKFIKDEMLPTFKTTRSRLNREVSGGDVSEGSKKVLGYLSALNNNIVKMENAIKEYESGGSDNWIYEKSTTKRGDHEFTIEPIWAYPYLEKFIWSHYDHVVLMSGTILNQELFSKLNGIEVHNSSYIGLDSTFPVENRQVYYFDVGKMSYKEKDKTFSKQLPLLERILKKHANDKGIIHTVSFDLANKIYNGVANNTRLLMHTTDTKESTIEHHFNSNAPTILLSPSMKEGLDLMGILCKVNIVTKIGYPSLASPKIAKRLENMPEWYTWYTVCSLIQMLGRGVRSEIDTCSNYIVDGSFTELLRRGKLYFPQYFLDSIIYASK